MMLRALLIIATTIFATNTYAQSVEERLTECIAQSQRIVKYADAWKASLEVIGERARPSDFAEIVTSYAYEDLLKGTLESLRSNDDQQEIVNQIEQASNPILLRTELIKGMVEEAFSKENRYANMAKYISGCVKDFKENLQRDGEFLAAENERLKEEISTQEMELARSLDKIRELEDSLDTYKGQASLLQYKLDESNELREKYYSETRNYEASLKYFFLLIDYVEVVKNLAQNRTEFEKSALSKIGQGDDEYYCAMRVYSGNLDGLCAYQLSVYLYKN